jgi:GDP-mannose 6-dehydrogenase
VVGERGERAAHVLGELYAGIEAPMLRTSIRIAEMLKYCDNAFHALKVSFANEIGNLCKKMNVDSHEVMALFCEDRKLNLSPAYLKPGFAFGGSCLPKDLRALTYQARRFDLDSPLLNSILPSNAAQVKRAVQMILALGRERVGFLGMAFKPGTDDLRESPLVELIETLLGKGYRVSIYDRHVSASTLIGANKHFIEEHIPHLASLLAARAEDVVAASDIVVVGYASAEFTTVLQGMRADQTIVDLARIPGRERSSASYDGICW